MYLTKYNSISAIISEYNPFHLGHQYHIKKTRDLTSSKYVISLMSGSFVQRGEPAVFDKYTRAKMALLNGADLVIELPTIYATQSASNFAQGAVNLLNSLNCVDYLSFGSECGDIDELTKNANMIANLTDEDNLAIKEYLKDGLSYPIALSKIISDSNNINVLNNSNNILAIEYIKSLKITKSLINPVTIKREGASYNETSLFSGSYASATAIREAILNKEDFSPFIPDNIVSLFTNPVSLNDFSDTLFYKLNSIKETGFTMYEDINEEISNRIIKNLNNFKDISSFIETIKSKNYTYTRISRCLLHILLDIKNNDSKILPSYARILGFKKDAKELLGILKENSSIPLISKLADASIDSSLMKDIDSTNLYSYISKTHTNEYTSQIVII
ncbi:MAG: nucleotidyltransferase [Lachnospiraceae bacterium]|nr:nucleotidyltransferase [Lachnospiraceae bacterium]